MSDLAPFLQAVRARLEKVTPGPWTKSTDWNENLCPHPQAVKWNDDTKIVQCHVCWSQYFAKQGTLKGLHNEPFIHILSCWDVDLDLIAHAPTDLARLLALVEAGEDLLETAKLFDGECKLHDTPRGGRCDNCGQAWPCQFHMLADAITRYTVACEKLG